MSISLDAIYQPLNQFFLQKFGQGDGTSVFFRFAQLPVGFYDSDFVAPSLPGSGPLAAVATEQLSNLVDGITRLDANGHGVWLDPPRISDLYHDEILGPSLPFLPTDLDADTKQQVIDSFSQVKGDATGRMKKEEEPASLINPGGRIWLSNATPPSWWKPDADVWTPRYFQIKGAATSAPDQPSNQLLRMKISDGVMQSILSQHLNPGEPAAPAPVAPAPQSPTRSRPIMLSHPTLQVARPVFGATMAHANIVGPQVATAGPATQPVIAAVAHPDSSVATYSDLMTRSSALPLRQRIELQTVLMQ